MATMKGSPDLIPAAGDVPTSLIFQVQQVLDITYSQRKAWPHFTCAEKGEFPVAPHRHSDYKMVFVSVFLDLDPSRVCKGKGVVTLRATLVHIDDEGHITEKPNVFTPPSKSRETAV